MNQKRDAPSASIESEKISRCARLARRNLSGGEIGGALGNGACISGT